MNTEDKIGITAILCLTERGAELAVKLSQLMVPSTVLVPERLQPLYSTGAGGAVCFFSQWRDTFADVFSKYKRIICIMAAGIVVRSLANLTSSKFNDPAIVVVDEAGRFAISLLSGHVGGANRLAEEVAGHLCGQAVITTATDVNNKPAVDLMAARMDACLEPLAKAKLINRLLAEGQNVYLYSPWPVVETIKSDFNWQEWPQIAAEQFREPAVIIGPHTLRPDFQSEYVQIKPRNLVVGIGCRRGVSRDEIRAALAESLEKFNLDETCVKSLATIDIKADEEGIRQLSLEMGIPMVIVTKAQIDALDGSYEASEWVKEKVGVGGVCEPA
ncbi:MAG: cobalt-precorrin 5A hydrolase [Firmicutes bacterium]|nr:cobalt-precorrin 5A hydrolase [Bacillota bacterium]